jgi:Tetratricopeptide repeat
VLLCVCAWAGAARAAGAGADSAEAHYKKGRSLYNVSEYRAALDEFKQAYVLHEDPALLYNIAQCHRQLGDNHDAVTFYKRFLNESPHAPNRKEIERLIGELESKGETPTPTPTPTPAAESPPPTTTATGPETAPIPAPAATEPAAPPPEPAARAGVHVELGFGGGGLHDNFTSLGGLSKGTATGATAAFQLAVTTGVIPRLALGVLAAGESVQSPKVQIGGVTNNNVSIGLLGFLGAAVDWRLDPRPAGWHFEGAVGGARLTVKDKSGAVSGQTPAGAALVLAAGYDWALTPSWQFGLLARFLGASLSDQGVSHDVGALSALALVSYH